MGTKDGYTRDFTRLQIINIDKNKFKIKYNNIIRNGSSLQRLINNLLY